MFQSRYWSLLIFIISLSCNQINNKTEVTFHVVNMPPFPPNLESAQIGFDSNMTITLIDANRNGVFTDSVIPCDYINIGSKLYRQSKGVVFKSSVNFNYGMNGYVFRYYKLNNRGELWLSKTKFTNPDISIFNELPKFKMISTQDTTNQVYFEEISESLKYKFILLEFWAPSCSSCIEGMKYYNDNRQLFEDIDMKIIYIAHTTFYQESLNYLSKHAYDFAFYFVNPNVSQYLNCEGYPNGLLIADKNKYLGHFGFASPLDVLNYLKKGIN